MSLPALFLSALIFVESGGNDHAFNRGAYGPLQVRSAALADVNKALGTHYRLQDCFDRQISIRVCEAYLELYASEADLRTKALVWRYGPTGAKKPPSERYWRAVETYMNLHRPTPRVTLWQDLSGEGNPP